MTVTQDHSQLPALHACPRPPPGHPGPIRFLTQPPDLLLVQVMRGSNGPFFLRPHRSHLHHRSPHPGPELGRREQPPGGGRRLLCSWSAVPTSRTGTESSLPGSLRSDRLYPGHLVDCLHRRVCCPMLMGEGMKSTLGKSLAYSLRFLRFGVKKSFQICTT